MDSWLGSFIPDHHWKWIYNLPCLQQTKSPYQNQRVHCFTCSSGFLCWFGRYSFSVLLRHYKHLRLASTFSIVGEFYKVVVWLLVCWKLMRLSTGSFYCHRLSSKIHYFYDSPSNYPSYFLLLSWALPVSYTTLKHTLRIFLFQNKACPFIWPIVIPLFLVCVVLILCFVSMIFHV